MAEDWEWALREFPESATYLGDNRYNDRLTDPSMPAIERRKAHGVPGYEDKEEIKRTALHLAVKKYLETVQVMKKPNTLRKYRAVLNRLVDYLPSQATPQSITAEHLNDFMVHLKKKHKHDNNTVIHNIRHRGAVFKEVRSRRHHASYRFARKDHHTAD